MEALILSWRKAWGRPKMPFYMAQIAQTTYAGSMLGVWQAQQAVMHRVPHTGVAVSNDIYDGTKNGGFKTRLDKTLNWPIAGGSNPHPTNRPLLAKRLADIALVKTYGGKPLHSKPLRSNPLHSNPLHSNNVVFGPMYHSHRIEGNQVIVKFQYTGTGLATHDGHPPNWFELTAGKKYVKADAKIAGKDTIVVSSKEVVKPLHVRFGWHPLVRHNLINKQQLPAMSFRTDRSGR